jgi:hypothetical protein
LGVEELDKEGFVGLVLTDDAGCGRPVAAYSALRAG